MNGIDQMKDDSAVKQSEQPVERGDAEYDPRALVTIVTASSWIASHPSLDVILRAIESLGRYGGLSGCRHLVVCDALGDENPERRVPYETYKRALKMMVASNRLCTNVEVHELPARGGLAGVILAGFAKVTTPYVLVYEHDWMMIRHVDTRGILRALATSRYVNYIRLNKQWVYEAGWDYVLKPDVRRRAVPLMRTSCWSAEPHFSKTAYYRRMILPKLRVRPEGGSWGFEEAPFYGIWREMRYVGFDRAQRRWGTFVYGQIGDPPVIYHQDGRKGRLLQDDGTKNGTP